MSEWEETVFGRVCHPTEETIAQAMHDLFVSGQAFRLAERQRAEGAYDDDFICAVFSVRRDSPHRFIITHDDADILTEEIDRARRSIGLELIVHPIQGPIAIATDDAGRVARYKAAMAGWLWQIFDRQTGRFEEGPEGFGETAVV